MCKCKMVLLKFIQKEWTLSEKILVGISLILAGSLAGVMIAPIKQGVKVNWALGSHNCSRNGCDSSNADKDNQGRRKGKNK